MESALAREIEVRLEAEQPDLADIHSIYFGGGTPSLFPVSGLKRLLNAFLPGASACREITLEANPEDVTRAPARCLALHGHHAVIHWDSNI